MQFVPCHVDLPTDALNNQDNMSRLARVRPCASVLRGYIARKPLPAGATLPASSPSRRSCDHAALTLMQSLQHALLCQDGRIQKTSLGTTEQTGSNGIKWAPSHEWSPVESYGAQWIPLVSTGLLWRPLEAQRIIWFPGDSKRARRSHMKPKWNPMESTGAEGIQLVLNMCYGVRYNVVNQFSHS